MTLIVYFCDCGNSMVWEGDEDGGKFEYNKCGLPIKDVEDKTKNE